MTIRRAMPVLVTEDPEGTVGFYRDVLGFRVAMEEDGMAMLASPDTPTTQMIIAWASPTAMDPEVGNVAVSMEVGDVDAAHAAAVAAGLEIVRPLTDEPWGIRRFFVRDPSGRIVNVAMHR